MNPRTPAPPLSLKDLRKPPTAAPEETLPGRVLRSAYEEFMDFGLRRASVDNIARRAGVARVSVYRHFPNKEALIRSVFLRESQKCIAAVDRAVSTLPVFQERLVEGFTAAARIARNHALTQRLLQTDPDILLVHMTTGAAPILSVARSYLARSIRKFASGIPPAAADAAAETVMRLGFSFILTRESCVKMDDDDSVRRYARNHILPIVMHG